MPPDENSHHYDQIPPAKKWLQVISNNATLHNFQLKISNVLQVKKNQKRFNKTLSLRFKTKPTTKLSKKKNENVNYRVSKLWWKNTVTLNNSKWLHEQPTKK